MRLFALLLLTGGLLAAGAVAPAALANGAGAPILLAEDPHPGAAERAAIRQVISDQLAAFRRDDGRAAFAYAAPVIREIFRTPENFMRMVIDGYQPVYRPRRVEFGELVVVDGETVQQVHLVGPDGRAVIALYQMQRQPDGSWKIAGCILVAPPGAMI
ncbi:MAG: DUF4864 domain-containing protein [Proteobacteria bacterium]|nr:DUF4864 domain-containing protein [Pseudomonadota bacterium]